MENAKLIFLIWFRPNLGQKHINLKPLLSRILHEFEAFSCKDPLLGLYDQMCDPAKRGIRGRRCTYATASP